LGIDENISIETIFGLTKLNESYNFNFLENINIIKTKYNYNVNKSNFYIGYNLQRNYNKSIIVDTNLIKFINTNLIDKIYIINNDFQINTLEKENKDNKFNYICEFSYQKYLLKDKNIFMTDLYINSIFYNMNLSRNDSIIFNYDSNYDYEKKSLMENIINVLTKHKINCVIYNDEYIISNNKDVDGDLDKNYITNLKNLNEHELNKYFNKSKIGISFCEKNLKIPFNMLLSGLKVIVFNNKTTSFDFPSYIFTKINSSENIFDIVTEIMYNDSNQNIPEYLDKNNNFNIEYHINSVCNYILC
jgi:hypothetical protein